MPAKESSTESQKKKRTRTASTTEPDVLNSGVSGAERKRAGTVEHAMSRPAHHVHVAASANDAARLMWEHDIGVIPVVDDEQRVVGIVTDRDIAMAAYLEGRRLEELPVIHMMSRNVWSVKAGDPLSRAATVMARHQVRRVPVVDEDGSLVGVLSLNDLASASAYPQADGLTEHDLAHTMRAICAPRMVPAVLAPEVTATA